MGFIERDEAGTALATAIPPERRYGAVAVGTGCAPSGTHRVVYLGSAVEAESTTPGARRPGTPSRVSGVGHPLVRESDWP